MSSTRPTTEAVKTVERAGKTYELFANGELWTTGEHAYFCGYVMDPENIEYAIDTHEEEMHFLCQDVLAEFGLA